LVNPQLMREAMQSSNLISFGQGATLPGDSLLLELEFATKEQPSFNRNFDLLINDLKNWASKQNAKDKKKIE